MAYISILRKYKTQEAKESTQPWLWGRKGGWRLGEVERKLKEAKTS